MPAVRHNSSGPRASRLTCDRVLFIAMRAPAYLLDAFEGVYFPVDQAELSASSM